MLHYHQPLCMFAAQLQLDRFVKPQPNLQLTLVTLIAVLLHDLVFGMLLYFFRIANKVNVALCEVKTAIKMKAAWANIS